WYFGSCGYVQGWIRGDLITVTPIITAAPIVTVAPTCVVPTEGQLNYVNYSAYVRVTSAEVRTGAGQANALICTLPYGTQVQVIATTYCRNMNLWCYVEYAANSYGYIIASSLASYTPTAVPQACVTAVPGYSIDYTDTFTGYTVMSKVLVRVTPGGEAVQRIEYRGTQVQVLGSTWSGNIKWYLVSYYGGTGFIRYDMISANGAPAVPTVQPGSYETPVSFSGMTTKNKCNVRSYAGFSSSVTDSLSYGTYLDVFGMQYDASGNVWYHVRYGSGRFGFIHSSLVTAYDEAAVRRYYNSQTAKPTTAPTKKPSTLSDNNPSGLHSLRTGTPKPTATPRPTATPTTAPMAPYTFVTAVPTALPGANRVTEMLEFSPVTLSAGQTLPVYSAPSSAAWRSDNGTAVLTTNRSLWVAGFEGQWMLVLYTNENSQIRVGYINAFRLSGALPTANTLLFAPKTVRLNRAVNLTSDPLGSSEVMLPLSAGSEITLLCACNLGSAWAYVETTVNGMPIRGFVPSSAVGQ
ncbi:MAG: SH3 domain-containing protein, partial [Clostridia bacterium]|nr:SH3 domain-containing protein [Clostridia bacterium]